MTADPGFLVVGTPRSGTTLVQRLACELPGVRVPPETHFFRLFAGPLLRRRRFPLDAAALRAELRAFAALPTSRGMGLDSEATIEDVVADLGGRCDSAVRLFGAIVRALAGEAAVRGEKTPSHLMWWRPLARALPAVRMVAVVRDPRAVVASYATAWGRRQPALLAQRWSLDQRAVLAMRRTLGPRRCLLLRYEDVVAEPDDAREALGAFLGVGALEAAPGPPGPLHLSWETWKRQASGPVTRDRLSAWRHVLDARESATVGAICGRRMAAFGYAGPGAAPAPGPRAVLAPERWRYRLHRAGHAAARAATAHQPGFGCRCRRLGPA